MFRVLLCITMEHDWRLVGVAALVCICSTFATFHLYARIPSIPSWRRTALLMATGLVAGSGIWTTHFVAMLAFETGLPTGYAALGTITSLCVAIASVTLGFAIGSATPKTASANAHAIGGGLIVGLGMTFMHYLGMTGYRTTGVLAWDWTYILASLAIGAAFSASALFLTRPGAGLARQWGGAVLLGIGIVGMHFTGMTAVTIRPDPSVAVPALLFSHGMMVMGAVAVPALIVAAAICGVAFDAVSRDDERRLREALDVMPEGLAFYDADDRLVAWNAKYADLCAGTGADLTAGMKFDDLLASGFVRGVYPEARGREAAWLSERRTARWGGIAELTQQTANGRWLRVTDRRTADGGTVTLCVDITDLKRAENAMATARDEAEELARRAEAAERIAGLGHWRLDARTNELTWSAQMYHIYGLPTDVRLDFDALLAMAHPDDARDAAAHYDGLLRKGESSENWITRIIRPTGETRYLECNSTVEHDAGGAIAAVIGTVVDDTERKAAQIAVAQSEERFRRLANNAPDIITESMLDGTLTYVSPASLPITGFAPEELTGKSFASLMHPEDAAKVLEMCHAVFTSKGRIAPWPVEFRAVGKSGGALWLECKPTLAVDPLTGRFSGLTDVIRDITSRKALEADLRHARAAAEAATAVKAEFLANMSHDLRTPLTSIIGFTDLAMQQPELTSLTHEYLERVGNASRALLCTVNDVLDFSKLEAGQVAIKPLPTPLLKLCRSAIELFAPQAGAKDLKLEVDSGTVNDGLVVVVDADRVRQILLNLIGNAVKFTEAGHVTLKTRYDAATELLGVDIVDTGAGISSGKQQCLFKRFSQIDGSMTRAQGGSGLGLAICKGLVEAMGGQIGVESCEGEGSRFWFTISAREAAAPMVAVDAAPQEQAALAGMRVLVADDHPLNRKLARLFLAGFGAEVTDASDGEEAAQLASEWPFDVILMDMRMPGLGGADALKRIRASAGPNDATPIVAFTAGADAGFDSEADGLGFQGVLPKPFSAAALVSTLTKAISGSQITESRELVHV